MKKAKREKLESAGWRIGSSEDFLALSKEEAAFVEMKLALADSVRRRRQARKLTQTQLAKMVGSSQSRIAKMEVADPSVSIDLLMKTLLTMGASRTELARVISRRKSKARAAQLIINQPKFYNAPPRMRHSDCRIHGRVRPAAFAQSPVTSLFSRVDGVARLLLSMRTPCCITFSCRGNRKMVRRSWINSKTRRVSGLW